MPIQPVNQGWDRGFVKMPQIGSSLARLLTKHQRLWVDEAEGVDNDFTLDGLDGVNDNGNSTRGELFERLLGIDINTR